MSFSKKYEERVQKFSFLARQHFKAELYRYIYIVILGKHLSELCWIILMFLDSQWILTQGNIQHKILNWSFLLLFFSTYK